MNPALRELGFSPADRVVVVHADDVGMCHDTLAAMEELFAVGVVTSASVMVPCPCFPEIAAWRKTHLDADLGVHLTLTSEFSGYRWGPVSTRSPSSGLIDEQGFLHRTPEAVRQNANGAAVRTEMEAQIDLAEKSGLTPSHFDSHMYALMCEKFVEDYIQVGLGRSIPVFLPRVLSRSPGEQETQRRRAQHWEMRGMPVCDHLEVVTRQSRIDDRESLVRDVFKQLSVGLTCILLHPAVDSPELRSIAPDWRSRVADFEAFRDPDLLDYVKDLGIHLISYQPLRDAMRSRLQGL